jgi:CO/xanthine dehydrogenase FAD-binding subunit
VTEQTADHKIAGAARPTVVAPSSPDEAIVEYGDGSGVTVLAGGTILVPEMTYGRLRPERVLMLHDAGLREISGEGTLMIGAMVPVQVLVESSPEPLASAARGVGDFEVRSQATIGGNLCAPAGAEGPRGDLQGPLIALNARVRSAGAGGERLEPVEDFMARDEPRLVIGLEVDRATHGAYVSLGRRHAQTYTTLSVAVADTADGLRIAVGGASERGLRCLSVERALAEGASIPDAAREVLNDVEPRDDALASAWYRRRVLATLVTRALNKLKEGR